MKIGAGSILTMTMLIAAVVIIPIVSAGVDYDLTVKDRKGTVFRAKGAGTETVGGHDDIDITKLRSYLNGDEIFLELTVVGNIQSDDAFDYDIRMDVNGDEDTDFSAEYENESCELWDGEGNYISSLNYTISGNTLTINVSKELLGDHDDFDILAQSSEVTDRGYYDLTSWASLGSDDDGGGFLPGFGIIPIIVSMLAGMTFIRWHRRVRLKQ